MDIPYVLVDANIKNTHSIAYFGTHSYDSGHIAGRLMYEQLKRKDDIAVFRFVSKGETMSNQVQQREKGFRDYLHALHEHTTNENTNGLLRHFFQALPLLFDHR